MVRSDTAAIKKSARALAKILPAFGAALTYKQCLDVLSRLQGFPTFEAARTSLAAQPTGYDRRDAGSAPSPSAAPLDDVARPDAVRSVQRLEHDLELHSRTATMVLRSQIDCLEKAADSPENASLRANNAIALDSVAAMTEMAANLAVVARSGEVAVNLSRVDLAEVLEELRTSRCRSAALRHISLKVKASGVSIVTDRRLLQRILYNLTDSVIEHSGATKAVVGVRMHGEDCMMQVVDNGPGASGDEGSLRDSIYGLGRFVVRSLVKKLGGSIRFDARAGRGNCIRVVLPGPSTHLAPASWSSAAAGLKSR